VRQRTIYLLCVRFHALTQPKELLLTRIALQREVSCDGTASTMGSNLSKRKASEDDGVEDSLVVKKARVERWHIPDIVVSVGTVEFEEFSNFLLFHSGYFRDELESNRWENRIEFPDNDPQEWQLFKSVLSPFSKDTVTQDNYPVLLPWFAKLRCEGGLLETDRVILTSIVEPLLAKEESQRSPENVKEVVTVLEHCVTSFCVKC
jgi:hypothetical protein